MRRAICTILALFAGITFSVAQNYFTCSTNSNDTLTITGYTGPGGNVLIPTNINGTMVAGIAANAFLRNTNLTGITILSNITNIGANAFEHCDLNEVTLGNGFQNIGNTMFEFCLNLTNITMCEGLTNIGSEAFFACLSLTNVTIPNSVTTISSQAFENSGLGSVTLPDSVTNLGRAAFSDCDSLTNFVFGSGVTSIPELLFSGSSSLSNVIVPAGISNIGDYAFSQCSNLSDITFPNSLTAIGISVFEDCVRLTNLTLPASIASIESNSFEGCDLSSISILGNTAIGQYAFYETPLASVNIAGGIVGQFAFAYCTNLTNVILGGGVTEIQEVAFVGDPIRSIVIPSSVSSIGGIAFEDCLLTNIVISPGVESIGAYAFLGNPITSLYIPSSVTSIGDQAFNGCNNLTNVIIGTGVTNMVTGAFFGCANLTNVLFLGNAPGVSGDQDGPVFNYSPNVTVYYMPGTTGWSNTYGAAGGYPGAPTALWNPIIEAGDGNFGVVNGQFGFDIKGTPGIPIVVEACTNLANPVWTPVQSMTVTNGLVYFTDPNWSNYPTRYYGIGFP